MTTPATESDLRAATAGHSDLGRPRRLQAARLWPWVPALILASLIGTQMTVLASALDDPSFATEDDYYRKAVDWDAHMARQRQSQALGWMARAHVGKPAAGVRELSIRLLDARGLALSGAQLHGVALPNARAARPIELALEEGASGEYHAPLTAARAGVWELRLSATRGNDSFETTLRFELAPEAAP
jgi:nitrogen fixation protein FixH